MGNRLNLFGLKAYDDEVESMLEQAKMMNELSRLQEEINRKILQKQYANQLTPAKQYVSQGTYSSYVSGSSSLLKEYEELIKVEGVKPEKPTTKNSELFNSLKQLL